MSMSSFPDRFLMKCEGGKEQNASTWPSAGECDYRLPDGTYKHIRWNEDGTTEEWIDDRFL